MQATYALPKDSLAAVAVTDEPMGGSPQPTTAAVPGGVEVGRGTTGRSAEWGVGSEGCTPAAELP